MEQITDINTLQTTTTINMQDVLAGLQYKWMLALFIMSILILIYVLFKNFVTFKKDSKYKWIEEEMDIMAITPAVFIFTICLTFFTGFKGI